MGRDRKWTQRQLVLNQDEQIPGITYFNTYQGEIPQSPVFNTVSYVTIPSNPPYLPVWTHWIIHLSSFIECLLLCIVDDSCWWLMGLYWLVNYQLWLPPKVLHRNGSCALPPIWLARFNTGNEDNIKSINRMMGGGGRGRERGRERGEMISSSHKWLPTPCTMA